MARVIGSTSDLLGASAVRVLSRAERSELLKRARESDDAAFRFFCGETPRPLISVVQLSVFRELVTIALPDRHLEIRRISQRGVWIVGLTISAVLIPLTISINLPGLAAAIAFLVPLLKTLGERELSKLSIVDLGAVACASTLSISVSARSYVPPPNSFNPAVFQVTSRLEGAY